MTTRKNIGMKHRFEFLLDDYQGNRYLTKARYYYSMTDDEYEELMEVVDSNGRYESDNLYVMQTYDGLVREAIAKMAELMVCDTEYRTTLLSQIKASHKQVREIAKNKNGNLGFYELMQYEGSLKGLNYCVPIVEGFFKTPIADDEKDESEDIYPTFALTAQKEGFEDIAALYKMVADVERQHKIVFQYLCDAVKNGTLYQSEHPMVWICSECGYMHVGTEAWKVCPLCKAGQGYVDLHLPFEGVRQ